MTKKLKRETRPRGYSQYHITRCEPNDVWPNGGWSLYRITGDEIAKSVIWERYNTEKGWTEGNVKFRHSWPGYIGMYETWEEMFKAMNEDAQEIITIVSHDE